MSDLPIEEPDWTSLFDDVLDVAYAHSMWGDYVAEMAGARTLTKANGPSLERLVILHVLTRRALAECASAGMVSKPRKSNAKAIPRASPHVGIAATFGRAALALESELGLTPAARSRAGQVRPAAQAPRPADAYLRPPGELPAARWVKGLQGGVVPLRRKGR